MWQVLPCVRQFRQTSRKTGHLLAPLPVCSIGSEQQIRDFRGRYAIPGETFHETLSFNRFSLSSGKGLPNCSPDVFLSGHVSFLVVWHEGDSCFCEDICPQRTEIARKTLIELPAARMNEACLSILLPLTETVATMSEIIQPVSSDSQPMGTMSIWKVQIIMN
jgi:hypothetical protein